MENRVDAKKLSFKNQNLLQNKKRDMEKAKTVIAYFNNNEICRSSFLLEYFNEQNSTNCGVCDICLKKNKNLSQKEFQLIKNEIKNTLEVQSASLDEILLKVLNFEEDKIIKVIEFLLENEQLKIDKYNQFIWIA